MILSQRPLRGPIEIPNLLKEFYTDKVVIEIGCGRGDYLPIFGKYAKRVVAYEGVKELAEAAKQREDLPSNVKIIEEWVNPSEVEKGEFYYYWHDSTLKVYADLQKGHHKGIFASYNGVCESWINTHPNAPQGVSDFLEEDFLKWKADKFITFHASEKDNRNWFDIYAGDTTAPLSVCLKKL